MAQFVKVLAWCPDPMVEGKNQLLKPASDLKHNGGGGALGGDNGNSLTLRTPGPGEMAQHFRALALAEDQGSVASTHVAAHNSSSTGLIPSSVLPRQ